MLNLIEQTIKENKEIKITKNIKTQAKKWFLIKKTCIFNSKPDCIFYFSSFMYFFCIFIGENKFTYLLLKKFENELYFFLQKNLVLCNSQL